MNWLQTWIEIRLGYAIDWSGTAAWAGAVGTVGALFAAIAATRVPGKMLQARRLEFAAGVAHCTRLAGDHLGLFKGALADGRQYDALGFAGNYRRSGVPEIFDALLASGPEEWPSVELMICTRRFRVSLEATFEEAREALRADERSSPAFGGEPGNWQGVDRSVGVAIAWRERTIAEANRLLGSGHWWLFRWVKHTWTTAPLAPLEKAR